MKLEEKLHEELMRYRAINNYAKKMIVEQESAPGEPPPPPAGDATSLDAAGGADMPPPPPPAPGGDTPIGGDMPAGGDTEEIDITDLVNMTKSIKNELEDTKQDHSGVIGKMDDVFTKLNDLEQKLSQMDQVMAKIDELSNKIEDVKPKSPQEKLELRSLDSYPFNQKPNEFFSSKKGEMEMSGKNEYILTKDDVDNYSREITQSFNADIPRDGVEF